MPPATVFFAPRGHQAPFLPPATLFLLRRGRWGLVLLPVGRHRLLKRGMASTLEKGNGSCGGWGGRAPPPLVAGSGGYKAAGVRGAPGNGPPPRPLVARRLATSARWVGAGGTGPLFCPRRTVILLPGGIKGAFRPREVPRRRARGEQGPHPTPHTPHPTSPIAKTRRKCIFTS